ncbi:sensor histidine kinase [Microlunatus sp. GCM10028923]|uniref:sensor histidine kinase n=1 Tax=Microlunatus sp. GCM10028923 TaxID=3273400 RepID=UPI0036161B52
MIMGLRFRTRLTIMITGLVALTGLLLLGVEYVIINQLFRYSIAGAARAAPSSVYPADPSYTEPFQTTTRYAVETQLADTVLAGLMPWSVAALVACTALAAVLSYLLAGRAVGRIAEVTTMARDLSTRDLHRRLSLPGPSDEIKELGDTFDAMLDRLEAAFTAQQRFVANASHELRTPLTVSRTALEIPLHQGRVPPTMEGSVRTALKAGQQSERLINALLALTRSDDVAIKVEPEDLSAIVDDAVFDLAEQAERAGVTMINRQPPGLVVEADQTMLGQAVSNLIDNAITHNEDGGTVWIDASRTGDSVELRIENTGTLLSGHTVDLLREPFYRGTETRLATTRGRAGRNVGLGLSIVNSIAARHNGTLELTARNGGGLIAVLNLPAGAGPAPRPKESGLQAEPRHPGRVPLDQPGEHPADRRQVKAGAVDGARQ